MTGAWVETGVEEFSQYYAQLKHTHLIWKAQDISYIRVAFVSVVQLTARRQHHCYEKLPNDQRRCHTKHRASTTGVVAGALIKDAIRARLWLLAAFRCV